MVNDNESLVAQLCTQCGGAIDRVKMVCPYCGTPFLTKALIPQHNITFPKVLAEKVCTTDLEMPQQLCGELARVWSELFEEKDENNNFTVENPTSQTIDEIECLSAVGGCSIFGKNTSKIEGALIFEPTLCPA